jgi:ABC-type glutathione transport system ATPase component
MLITIKNNYSDIDIHQQDSLYDLILNHKLGKAQIFMRTYNQRMIREYKKIYELKNFSSILLIGTKRIDMYAPLFYLNKFTQEKLYENEKIKSQLFITILNNYFLNKNIALENNKLVIYSAITQKIIPIMALSSGEQHLFVLFYSLLFRTKPNTFVLFDEPETSLHITWQNRFVDDLLEILGTNETLNILVATHSPDLIAHHWNLTVELSEAKNYEQTTK